MQQQRVVHPLEPVWDARSRVLILGSFPSAKSREARFYYAHPNNRFWPLLSRLYAEPLPLSSEERRLFALRHGIALWDVVESCVIRGSSDASIRGAKPNDIAGLLSRTEIRRIFCNGQQAFRLFERYCAQSCDMPATPLPSTSPANAAWTLDRLSQAWRIVTQQTAPSDTCASRGRTACTSRTPR